MVLSKDTKMGYMDLIKSDSSPIQTHRDFIKEIGGTHELELILARN